MGGSGSVDQTVEGLARRLAAALDKNAGDDTAVFESRVRALEDLGPFKGELAVTLHVLEHRAGPMLKDP